jgi:uncharacterized protein YhaN
VGPVTRASLAHRTGLFMQGYGMFRKRQVDPELETGPEPDEAQRSSWRGIAILAIATLVVAGLAATYSSDDTSWTDRITPQPQSKADKAGSGTPAPLVDARQSPPTDGQSRRALDAERARSTALENELAAMRREAEARAAQMHQLGDDAKQQQAAQSTIAELRQSLQQERDKAALLDKEKAARQADAEQARAALDEASARNAALTSELAGLRREIEARAAPSPQAADQAEQKRQLESTVAELRQSLQQEQEKTANLLKETETSKQSIAANSEQYQRTIDGERKRSAALADELATTRSDSEKEATRSREASEELVQQRQAMEGKVAELQQALQQEREKRAALEKKAGAARHSMLADADQHRRALDEARARNAALASELAGARREVETQAALARKTEDEAAQHRQDGEKTMAKVQQPLKREPDATERTPDGVATTGRAADARVGSAAHEDAPASPAAADRQDTEPTRLLARASALLAQGNIVAARIVLERAAESGNAQASFMLAETYDPAVLSSWGAYRTRGERAKAREHYIRAQSGGIQEAKARLEALHWFGER